MRFSYVLLKNDCLTMSATVSGTGNLELIQKHNFRSLRAKLVYTHYRKNPPPKLNLRLFWRMDFNHLGQSPKPLEETCEK